MSETAKTGAEQITGPRATTAVQLPGLITDGHCPFCEMDLSFLFPKIESGEIEGIHFCTGCGKPLRDDIEVPIIVCGKCGNEIIDPEKEKFCHGCGRHLIYEPKQ